MCSIWYFITFIRCRSSLATELLPNLRRTIMTSLRYIDIGANLTDPIFRGMYHGKKQHADDYEHMLQRAFAQGVDRIIITGSNLEESKEALALAQHHPGLYCTIGCHPTRSQSLEHGGQKYYDELLHLATENKGKVVAIGECGLDYDRLHFSPADVQRRQFERQLSLASTTNLPLFLHSRNATDDFVEIVRRNNHHLSAGGVIHSFTDDAKSLDDFLSLGFSIGINGCSLKTAENLENLKRIPIDRLMIETDAPWCEIKPTHASFPLISTSITAKKKEKFESGVMVKGRNEPAAIVQVLEVVSTVRGQEIHELAEHIYANTMRMFFPLSA